MDKLTIIYRLSDKGNPKNKAYYINNKNCLDNFIKEFSTCQIILIADNVSDDTFGWLGSYPFSKIIRTSLGNAKSFWLAFQEALTMKKDEYVYFVENDYIHKPGSSKVIFEGLNISDYVTLYDHPDKYVDGFNPGVKNGSEKSRVYLTESTHWKSTNSTTMTFAARVDSLVRDRFFFRLFTYSFTEIKFPILDKYLGSSNPHDFWLFYTLTKLRGRKLISPVPGYSTHGESANLSPLIDWESVSKG